VFTKIEMVIIDPRIVNNCCWRLQENQTPLLCSDLIASSFASQLEDRPFLNDGFLVISIPPGIRKTGLFMTFPPSIGSSMCVS